MKLFSKVGFRRKSNVKARLTSNIIKIIDHHFGIRRRDGDPSKQDEE